MEITFKGSPKELSELIPPNIIEMGDIKNEKVGALASAAFLRNYCKSNNNYCAGCVFYIDDEEKTSCCKLSTEATAFPFEWRFT